MRYWLIAGLLCAGAAQAQDQGMIHDPHVTRPDGPIREVVVLLSDAGGWGASDDALARHLQAEGVATIGLDLPAYLRDMAAHDGDCIYTLADIEALSRSVQQGNEGDYRLPVIAGRGAGGALALAMAAQTPASTVAATVVVDPEAGVDLPANLCTKASYTLVNDREVYELTPGMLNDPIDAVFTPAAPADGKAHVAELAATYPAISQADSADAADAALVTALDARLASLKAAEGPLDLPITPLPATPKYDTMAVIYSGDGGWRDLDQQVGLYLQQSGVPVVGVDSLRYFWHERDPQDTADDLSRILERYRAEWGVKHVLLIGYSFGADILPATYNLLPQADRDSVAQMTLLALSHRRDYEIQMTGWLGIASDSADDPVDDLAKLPDPGLVQCIYGTDDPEGACGSQSGKGYELIGITGGHHFDGDYRALTDRILDGLRRRL